jgi:hypothetical protein
MLIIDWPKYGFLKTDCSQYLNQCPSSQPFTRNNPIFIMPLKARISFKAFIAHRENYQNNTHSAVRKGGRVFNSCTELEKPCNEGCCRRTSQSVAFRPKENRDLHAIEGTLEMQKMLLQKLARGENIEKGYQDRKYSTDDRETGRGSPGHSSMEVGLEEWKRDMAQALHTIWGKSQSR